MVRIGERTNTAESRGVDVSSVDLAIAAAQAAISSAKTAVEAQATKTYTLTIDSEDKLRTDISKTRKALYEDLQVVYGQVKIARDAVHEAARAYAKAHGRDLPSPSVTISPTSTITPTPVLEETPIPTP